MATPYILKISVIAGTAELEEENYHLRSELQTEVDINRQNERRINQLEKIERLENASKKAIVELKSEISTLKSQLYQARKDVRDKGKYISSLEEQLIILANQGVDLADNAGGPPTGRDQAIGYLRGCMRGRTLEWFDDEITTKQNWELANLLYNTGQANLVAVNGRTAIQIGANGINEAGP
ncbi:16587_t:CDS:2 [Funneliformis geosporum]|uniref:16587_t:CDS:1 n=1 Tax=Funneliformis geosporum TaxID=1117311 RepID=A0A9W4SUV4_9GLOM|nr:16587_t:CDS:2 [Funneliformis geosporum]